MNTIYIVSGIPRSGTSMMMQMIHAAGLPIIADRTEPSPRDPGGVFEVRNIQNRLHVDCEDFYNITEALGKWIKIPSAQIPLLPTNYNYKVLYMLRNLREVSLSMQRAVGHRSDYVSDEKIELLKTDNENILTYMSDTPCFDFYTIPHRNCIRTPLVVAQKIAGWLPEWNISSDAILDMANAVNEKWWRCRMGYWTVGVREIR